MTRSVFDLVTDLRGRVASNDRQIAPGKVLRLLEECANALDDPRTELENMMPIRDRLAWAVVKGERITDAERALLAAIDAVLDELDTGPDPVPSDVLDLAERVLRG